MSGGKLLSIDEQIKHLIDKGIKFDLCSETEARHFLREHSYLTKVSAYRKNYAKHSGGPEKGKYINLDFAYLIELSTIDMHLRYLVMSLCLDVEHALKISLINDAIDNPEEDGYRIVQVFARNEFDFMERTRRKMTHSYCRDLYCNNADHLPLWVLLEMLSFGDLINLYKIYFKVYSERMQPIDARLLEHVRDIRNACAHSNCLIDNINRPANVSPLLSNIMSEFTWLTKTTRKRYLRRRFTQDFTSLLLVHRTLVKSEGTHMKARTKLRNLFYKRMMRNRVYFKSNDIITNAYSYCFKLIRYYFT